MPPRRRGRPLDYALVGFSVLGVSVPVFILASLLQYVFATELGWFPVAPVEGLCLHHPAHTDPGHRLHRRKNPQYAHADAGGHFGGLRQDCQGKGLSSARIVWSHQIRNAIIPMIPSLGMEIVTILMGSFVVEQIFAIPGIGAYFVQSIQSLDYTMTLGLTVFFGVFVVSANFVIDLIYGLVDPRIRVAK